MQFPTVRLLACFVIIMTSWACLQARVIYTSSRVLNADSPVININDVIQEQARLTESFPLPGGAVLTVNYPESQCANLSGLVSRVSLVYHSFYNLMGLFPPMDVVLCLVEWEEEKPLNFTVTYRGPAVPLWRARASTWRTYHTTVWMHSGQTPRDALNVPVLAHEIMHLMSVKWHGKRWFEEALATYVEHKVTELVGDTKGEAISKDEALFALGDTKVREAMFRWDGESGLSCAVGPTAEGSVQGFQSQDWYAAGLGLFLRVEEMLGEPFALDIARIGARHGANRALAKLERNIKPEDIQGLNAMERVRFVQQALETASSGEQYMDALTVWFLGFAEGDQRERAIDILLHIIKQAEEETILQEAGKALSRLGVWDACEQALETLEIRCPKPTVAGVEAAKLLLRHGCLSESVLGTSFSKSP
jgi:hypothetical protein